MATLNDFIKECEMFPYSKENFELVKEAAEINVAALYVETQTYMAENADEFDGLGSDYMMEAVNDDSVKQLEQKAGGKKEKWAQRAKDIWKRIVAAFKTFWNAIVERYNKLRGKAADVKKNLGVVKITPEMAKEIGTLVDSAVKQSGIPISDKQQEGFKKLPRGVITTCEDSVKNRLAAAICNSSISLVINNPGQFALAFSEKQLKDLFKFVSDKKVLAADGAALKSLMDMIERYQGDNLKKGISVSKDKEEMEELIKYINDSEAKLAKDIETAKANPDNKGVGDVTNLFSNVQTVAHNSIKLYTSIVRFQEIVLNGLDGIIKKAPAAKEADKE